MILLLLETLPIPDSQIGPRRPRHLRPFQQWLLHLHLLPQALLRHQHLLRLWLPPLTPEQSRHLQLLRAPLCHQQLPHQAPLLLLLVVLLPPWQEHRYHLAQVQAQDQHGLPQGPPWDDLPKPLGQRHESAQGLYIRRQRLLGL
ncbi:hypothetical protein BT93_L4004 [Corymbia citriodora subsp. variegata]|uniref:Uncharacterized protein n=1 Tax=Corymbia citriodora subsp. variegata TaxID=360336 RepID=A0A8T0CKF5_CORYI|nr:hypothetical protein BT93_L4004 [Corymbia citriodora subsp. variegata]